MNALGDLAILDKTKTAFFCSARCPGDAILSALDTARRWRDEGRCVISGFHSPVEKECLRTLLRGESPLIICPARSLHGMRIPRSWKKPLKDGRLLLLSFFSRSHRRLTSALAQRRNECVAALADGVHFFHTTPGGQLERLSSRISEWNYSNN